MTEPVVNMTEHFDVDATMEAVTRERFAMPPAVIAAFRQAAMKSAAHLLKLVEDEKAFGKLKINDQLKVMELIFERAYGRAETATSSMMGMHKTGQLDSTGDHSRQLKTIEERMAKRDRQFPELKTAQRARRKQLSDSSPSKRNRSMTLEEVQNAEIVNLKDAS